MNGKRKKTGMVISRRVVLVAGMIVPALLLLSLAYPVSAEVTQEKVKEVAKGLACLCGDCPRRPLDECACGWADRKRSRIAEALEAGQDKETIVAGFVAEFGQEAYVTPPAEGFNLTAWIMPIVVPAARRHCGAFGVTQLVAATRRSRRRPGPGYKTGRPVQIKAGTGTQGARSVSVAFCIVIVAVVFIFVFRPFITTRGRIGEADAGSGRGNQLLVDREALYDAIRELDFDYRMGKVEEGRLSRDRSRYESRAVELMRAIEETTGPPVGIEDRIEQEIAALRERDTGACAGCGDSTPEGARFCPRCGKALSEPRL